VRGCRHHPEAGVLRLQLSTRIASFTTFRTKQLSNVAGQSVSKSMIATRDGGEQGHHLSARVTGRLPLYASDILKGLMDTFIKTPARCGIKTQKYSRNYFFQSMTHI
jgi:hypothetical protein